MNQNNEPIMTGEHVSLSGERFTFDRTEGDIDDVRMLFRTESGDFVLWSPHDCPDSGTPIDDETGDDLEYVCLVISLGMEYDPEE